MKKNKNSGKKLKLLFFILIVIAVMAAYFFGGKQYLTLSYLQQKIGDIQSFKQAEPLKCSLIFFGTYVAATALSFPGASVLTLLGGAIFGPWLGLLIVSFASSAGSFCAFLIARFLLKDFFMDKFHQQFQTFDKNIKKDGIVYLATLRLIPAFPFFIVNIVMGLTSLKAWTFYWVSQLAMLPGTAVYVYAGQEFSQLESLKGILSPQILLAFVFLATLPFLGKLILSSIKRRKAFKNYNRPSSYDYNLVTIGAGSGGLVTSFIGAAVKSKVALIEKEKMGGDCLNTGCVPSKALIKSAKIVHLNKRASEFGLSKINIEFNFSEVMARVQRVIAEIEPHDSVERYQEMGVECITGEAKIVDPWTIKVGAQTIRSKKIVIATGAGPLVPKIPGLEEAKYVTSETLWSIRELPKRFVIMGGGPIGAEMAQAFSRFGSEVTIIEAGERLLSKEDPEISKIISNIFVEEGIKILTSHKVISFIQENGLRKVICESEGKTIAIEYDLVLVAVGRKANTRGFGLEELGVKLRENGTIDVNEYMETNLPNIFACGDVTGPYQLTHMAAHQAWYCAVNSLFPIKFKVDYSTVPWCTYTDPEVATVGETETTAKNKNIEYEVTEYNLSELDRAITENEKNGFVRVITQKGKDKILGATIVGTQASSMIVEYVAAMKNKKGLKSILSTIHVYPSFGEANKYAAGQWKKNHVNEKIYPILTKYFKWTRG
ncbi:MAG: dihydrolipoyl dehydrogenase [Bdellovibrionales bacterium]|nr:dihydrolipoyl dehydrogenase [Bdellovibrionales bacterium]